MAADDTAYELFTKMLAALQAPLSTTLPANQSVNLAQMNGNAIATGAGTGGSATVLRVVTAIGSTATLVEFAFGASLAASQTFLAAGTTRQGVLIVNDTDVAVFLRFGAVAASTSSYSVKLIPGAIYEPPRGFAGVEVRGIGASAGTTGAVRVTTVI